MKSWTPSEFLRQCETSSQDAYELFKHLIDEAHSSGSHSELRVMLTELIRHCEDINLDVDSFMARYHFNFQKLALGNESGTESNLMLLQFPSIFTPEEWSFTFYEGLARYPSSEFQGRTIAELGCGNGWISIALAAKASPQKIIGLDINPRAITCAKINLLLNALDDSGARKIDKEGKSLLERVEFHTSDLLSEIIQKKLTLDRVIGCIPQVLSPEPLVAAQFVSEDSDDTFLYSLSNYCSKQGYIEDQFGLGLIARALEETISVAKPSAKVILNLGGRPGTAVLEKLFLRRGFSIRKIWSTKVWQAEDTDIQPLVEIEKMSAHRFEFFTSLSSDEPICAKTAHAYMVRGGRIAHSLAVYEAQIKHPSSIKSIFNLIRQNGFEDSRNGLDLAFDNDDLAEEKINFIGSLAEWLQQKPNLPYSDAEGEPQLRRQIAQFLRSYWKIPITAKSIFVAPNRRSIIKNQINFCKPNLVLAERDLYQQLNFQGLKEEHKKNDVQIVFVEAPKRVDEICKLIDALKPQLVITSLQDFEIKTSDAFVRLSENCARNESQLVVDLSQQFELSSQPTPNGVLSYLSENVVPSHVLFLIGLVRNKVYKDLEMSFVISENQTFLETLSAAAELTYSRPPLLTQRYYGRIFADLLNFQLTDLKKSNSDTLRLPKFEITPIARISSGAARAFQHPSIKSQSLKLSSSTIRMDYGENCLNSPPQLYSAIMESFLRQNASMLDLNCEKPILDQVQQRLGLDHFNEKQVLLGNGVAPIFSAFLETITDNKETICLPTGSYGYFKAACEFVNTDHYIIETHEKKQFKIDISELDRLLFTKKSNWLYLNAPIVNPTGAIYTNGELIDLLDVLAKHNCGLVVDTIFSGLEHNKRSSNINLNRFRALNHNLGSKVKIFIMGGLSKELAAGGLRFGWAISDHDETLQGMKNRLSESPHSTTRYAARKMYLALNEPSHLIHEHLDLQRELIKQRSLRLTQILTELGWDVIEPEGGLFVCASPRKYLNFLENEPKTRESWCVRSAADQIAQELFDSCDLLVNNATWTGLPSHLRFVVSLEAEDFEKGLVQLRAFDSDWQIRNQ